jgi:hypothetical protein
MKRAHVVEFSRPDIDGHTIKAVKVIGLKSKNGWRYPPEVLKEAMPLYEGSPVFIEHPDEREKKRGHRQLTDHFGSLENVRGNGKGLYADLKIRKAHPMAKAVLEAAPTARFGLSHNALVDFVDDQKTEVSKIVQVNSVDLVDRPGTTQNLFEEEDDDKDEFQAAVLEALDQLSERLDKAEAKPKPPARLTALEDRGEENEPEIGNSHEDFLNTIRGFAVK